MRLETRSLGRTRAPSSVAAGPLLLLWVPHNQPRSQRLPGDSPPSERWLLPRRPQARNLSANLALCPSRQLFHCQDLLMLCPSCQTGALFLPPLSSSLSCLPPCAQCSAETGTTQSSSQEAPRAPGAAEGSWLCSPIPTPPGPHLGKVTPLCLLLSYISPALPEG